MESSGFRTLTSVLSQRERRPESCYSSTSVLPFSMATLTCSANSLRWSAGGTPFFASLSLNCSNSVAVSGHGNARGIYNAISSGNPASLTGYVSISGERLDTRIVT